MGSNNKVDSKAEKARVYLLRNKSLPDAEKLSMRQISKLVECTPKYVGDVRDKMEKELVVAGDKDFQVAAKEEAEKTLEILKGTVDALIQIKAKLEVKAEGILGNDESKVNEIKEIVETVVTASKEARNTLRFLHELKGDLSGQKQGNIIIFYKELMDDFTKAVGEFIGRLPIDLRIELLEIMEKYKKAGRKKPTDFIEAKYEEIQDAEAAGNLYGLDSKPAPGEGDTSKVSTEESKEDTPDDNDKEENQ